MIRRTVTASALFLAMAASGGDFQTEESERRGSIEPIAPHGLDIQQPISLHPDWSQRWEGQRCLITTPRNGEHLAMWFRIGNDATSGDPGVLLEGFIDQFVASASTPSMLGVLPAERVIGKGISAAGRPQIGVALLAPTASGTLILASRGVDAALPGRFRDLMVMSTFV